MRNRIRELRETSGVSQESLAKAIGVSRQTVISLEAADRYSPSLKLAYTIASHFELPVEEVFIREDPESACPHAAAAEQ